MLATETSSTNRCGATATTPAAAMARRVQQRDRAAVAVAEEPGPLDADRPRTARAAPRRPGACMKSGWPSARRAAWASSGRSRSARRRSRAGRARRRSAREILPHRERAEAFVQEHDRRRGRAPRRRPTRYSMRSGAAAPVDARRSSRRRRVVGASALTAPALLALAQAEALDLAGRGLRQLVDELERARVLVRREPLLDEGLELGVARRVARLDDDEGLGLDRARRRPRCRSPPTRAPPGAASASPRPRTARPRRRSPSACRRCGRRRCSSRRRRASTCRRCASSRPGRCRAMRSRRPSTSVAALGPLDVEVADLAVGRPARPSSPRSSIS